MNSGHHDVVENTPRWIPLLFGGVMLLMGAIIVGAAVGIIPVAEEGRFLAPPLIIMSLGIGLGLGGVLLWIPDRTPPVLRTCLFLVSLALGAVVCNWTAFAPNVVYESSTSVGPITMTDKSDTGARIAFGVVALIVDGIFISTLLSWFRFVFHGASADN
jgi:hypothetical protein